MSQVLRGRMRPTDDTHRVTSLELFFDLVFVYALTQVTDLMSHDPTWLGALRGLLVLGLLWFSWTAFAWLGNQAKADEGLMRVGLVAAMVSVFTVALAIPEAFHDLPGGLYGPLVFAAGFVVVRGVHLGVYLLAAGDDAGLRQQLLRPHRPSRSGPPCSWPERSRASLGGWRCGGWHSSSTTWGSSSEGQQDGDCLLPGTSRSGTG